MEKYNGSFTNRAGRAISGATVTVYTGGALATIYDDDETTTLANPLTTTADGTFGFRGANAEYTLSINHSSLSAPVSVTGIVLNDASESPSSDAAIRSTASNKGAGLVGFLYASTYAASTVGKWLQDLALSTGASFIGWIQSGAGATLRTVQAKLRDIISAQDFGAVGGGTTDDTTAFTAADTLDSPYLVPAGSYKLTTELLKPGYSFGAVTFTGGGGAPIHNLAPNNRLPVQDKLFAISDTSELDAPKTNILTNGSFYVWPSGMATSISATGDSYVCGNWRMKSHATVTAASIAQINSINGGLSFAATFDATADYLYVRQLAPVVIPLSERTFTMSADVEVDATVAVDLYIQARLETNDATRVLVTDTPNLTLASGRHRIAATFTVPDISADLSSVDIKNSLEFALRFYGQSLTVNCKVYEIIVTPGYEVTAGCQVYPARDFQDVELYYETGSAQFVGFDTGSGQKRVTAPFRTKKIMTPGGSNYTISDLAGNTGKCSTYDASGTRTDNVAYTAVSITDRYVVVIVNASTAAGLGFNYTINCYP